jgi:putative intracellular protease/amidase
MSLRDPNPVNPNRPKRVAIVISNPAISTTTGWPVGFWWSELAHPYHVFHEHGYQIEVFSPSGGKCEPDALSDPQDPSGYSAADLVSMGFIATPSLAALVEDTKPVAKSIWMHLMESWSQGVKGRCSPSKRPPTYMQSLLSSMKPER